MCVKMTHCGFDYFTLQNFRLTYLLFFIRPVISCSPLLLIFVTLYTCLSRETFGLHIDIQSRTFYQQHMELLLLFLIYLSLVLCLFCVFLFLFSCILQHCGTLYLQCWLKFKFIHLSLSGFLCRSVSSLSNVKLVGVAVSQTDRQTVTVNDSDASLSVTRIHPVVMLQADRKSLLLWASVTHTHTHTVTVVSVLLLRLHSLFTVYF